MDWEQITEIFELVVRDERNVLTEIEAKKVLECLSIDVPLYHLAESAEEAVSFAKQIGFPVVLKIVSPEIIHKSDAKGVFLNLSSEAEVAAAFAEIQKNAKNYNPQAKLQGVSVQKMLMTGTEVIIGMKRDPVFGPVLLFGLGGVFVELLEDVSLKVLPLTELDIESMFHEIKAAKILNGYRGSEPVDLEALKTMIGQISELCSRLPEITEMELNPVFVMQAGSGAVAADARILIQSPESGVVAWQHNKQSIN